MKIIKEKIRNAVCRPWCWRDWIKLLVSAALLLLSIAEKLPL